MLREENVKLGFGDGSIYKLKDGMYAYKKNLLLPDGTRMRKRVTGESKKVCIEKMAKVEEDLNRLVVLKKNSTLSVAIVDWFDNIKSTKNEKQTNIRIKSTIRCHILNSDLGNTRYALVTTEQLQEFIDSLNEEKELSKSSIDKVYQVLNGFYRYQSLKDGIYNPMSLVINPRSKDVKKDEKVIEWYEEDEIPKFINEAISTYKTGKIKHKYGCALAANIFIGLRIGELLALKWSDIDFEHKVVSVTKTLIEVENDAYDYNNPELMKKKGIPKKKLEVQNFTKNKKNRKVNLNNSAIKYLWMHKERSVFTEDDDFVFLTTSRKNNSDKHMYDAIKEIQNAAGLNKKSSGTHILRHTCSFLHYLKGTKVEEIARILGNSPDVCRKYYLHFSNGQLQDAVDKLDEFDF